MHRHGSSLTHAIFFWEWHWNNFFLWDNGGSLMHWFRSSPTHSYMWHDTFVYVTCHVTCIMCMGQWYGTMTHSNDAHVSCVESVIGMRHCPIYECIMSDMTHSYTCNMTHSYVRHDAFIYVTRYMTHSYMWRDSFIYVQHDAFICATWHIHICDTIHDSFIYVTWLIHICGTWRIHMCDMTHSYMWHDTWLIHICDVTHSYMCNMTHSYVRHDAFIYVTRYMTHSYMWRDSFIYVQHDAFTYVTWLTHICDMIHSCTGQSCIPQPLLGDVTSYDLPSFSWVAGVEGSSCDVGPPLMGSVSGTTHEKTMRKRGGRVMLHHLIVGGEYMTGPLFPQTRYLWGAALHT